MKRRHNRAPEAHPRRRAAALLRVVAAAVAASLVIAPARAQTDKAWPQRPVTFIVSQAAGASPDVMARLLADRLSKSLGQGVVVENKPGGGNVIGANAAARAAPDGYTFFFATSAALVTNPYLMKNLSYDPLKDFVPVAMVTRSHQLVVVYPETKIKTLADLIAAEKAAPGSISIGVDSPRALAGVTAQAINKRGGTAMVLVPYPNINSGLQDAVAGRIQVGVFSVSIVESLVADGKLRAIAVASGKRSATMPAVPTVAESLPGFDFSGWFMLMAPAGTPGDIIAKLNAEVASATRDEKIREMAPKLGFEMDPGTPEAARQFLKDQMDLWQKITTELAIEAQ